MVLTIQLLLLKGIRKNTAIKQEIIDKILKEKKNYGTSCGFTEARIENFKKEIAEYIEQDEDVLSYASFPQVAKKYFEYRQAMKYKIDPDMVNKEEKVHPI